jgi:hypothetical protein
VEHVEENLKFVLTNVYKDTSLEYYQRFFFLLDMVEITFLSFLQNLEKIDFDVEEAKDIISILKQREKRKIRPNLLKEQELVESCEHMKEISFFCVDCQKSLCDKCKETHKSEHEIFPLTELQVIPILSRLIILSLKISFKNLRTLCCYCLMEKNLSEKKLKMNYSNQKKIEIRKYCIGFGISMRNEILVDVLKSNFKVFQTKYKEFIDKKFIEVTTVESGPKYCSNEIINNNGEIGTIDHGN